jgi:hypothetical protein
MESGWDKFKFDVALDYHLKQKCPKLASIADIMVCYDYLKILPKWNASMESQTPSTDNHSRPNEKMNNP